MRRALARSVSQCLSNFRHSATAAVVASQTTDGGFNHVPLAPHDPILGVFSEFSADRSPTKVNLSIGIYRGDDGQACVLDCVKQALPHVELNMDYGPILGLAGFIEKAQSVAFAESTPLLENRIASAQTLSGTGALRVGFSLIASVLENRTVYIPTPTWANHIPMLKQDPFDLQACPYYHPKTYLLDFEGMISSLSKAARNSVVLLQACAHNPTGVDPSEEQWKEIVSVIKKRKLFPFVDMAYQGFATGDLDKDAFAARLIAAECPNSILCQSFSKNFGLYGQRTGAIHVVCQDDSEKERILSQIQLLHRQMYATPPTYGARLVDIVLGSPALTIVWKKQLSMMAGRMNGIRKSLVELLRKEGSQRDWSHLTKQIGMMAYTGLTPEQVMRLKSEFHVYLNTDGRASVTGLNTGNVAYVAHAFHRVTS